MSKFGLTGHSLVCFAGEDWWYHHPHSKNHILKRLSEENQVLFVNSIGMGLPRVSNPDFFLKIRRKLRSYSRWLRRVPEGLWVLSPVTVPFYGFRFVRWLNAWLLVLQVRMAMMIAGMKRPLVWAAIPFVADAVERLGAEAIVYQVSDKYDSNEDSAISADLIRELDGRLKNLANVVFYSGRKLYEEATEPHRYFLEQAVDFEHFASTACDTPADILSIPRPVLGYIGWIDYVVDAELVQQVAVARPDWHWVFIGRKSNLVQISAPNVHFLGPKPYSELPKYLRHIDVCILPFRQDSIFAAYGSAIKVREYLATGKPTIISPLYEYRDKPGLRVYGSVSEFIAHVEDALGKDTEDARRLRQQSIRGCTWDVRALEVGTLFRSLLESAGKASSLTREREAGARSTL